MQTRRALCQGLRLLWHIVGKLDATHAVGQAWEDVTNKANVTIDLFAVNPYSAFYIKGLVNQYTVNFMLDTGAAVSLISSKLWHSLKDNVTVLVTGESPALVGVGGHPVVVQGTARLNVTFGRKDYTMDTIVADLQGMEAIVGLDFLTKNEASIDTSHKILHLIGLSQPISLDKPDAEAPPKKNGFVVLEADVILPAQSQLEIIAKMKEVSPMQTTLIEGRKLWQHPSVLVATAVIESKDTQIPIRLINLAYDDTILYKGTKVAEATVVDHPLCVSEIQESHKVELTDDVSKAKQQQLWEVVEKTSSNLIDKQRHQLFALLLEYADVFATDSGDLGNTSCVQHSIRNTCQTATTMHSFYSQRKGSQTVEGDERSEAIKKPVGITCSISEKERWFDAFLR